MAEQGRATARYNQVAKKTLEKALGRAHDPEVARDMETLGGMVQIWCADHHADRERSPYDGFGMQCGAYRPKRVPNLCPECAAHVEYGELRRCLCPHDPKPSCRVCEIHCYKPDEAAWQRQVMAYAGPRAMFRGMFFDALRHLKSETGSRRRKSSKER